jgi:hypothetical protein
MPGRHAKPIGLHLLEGNPNNLTKEEIEKRKADELHIGTQEFVEPVGVRKNKVAHAKWCEIMRLKEESEADWITSADTSLIERTCMTDARIKKLELVERNLEKIITKSGGTEFDFIKKSNELSLCNNIIKASELLKKLWEQLGLTPRARIGHIGKKVKKEEETPLQKAGFGFV